MSNSTYRTCAFVGAILAAISQPGCDQAAPPTAGQAETAVEQVETPAPAPKELSGDATVRFVYFKTGSDGKPTGGTSPATLSIRPNPTREVSVGILEEFVSGAGVQMRTAGWMAAFNACRVADSNLTDHEFLLRIKGHVDGPSAGMLTTAGFIALLRGEPIRDDTTMTGTINPDGSAGPVGGISFKMEGAKVDGLTRFGFPVGCRLERHPETGAEIDVVDKGRSLGLEVREITDIYQAYEFLTGVRLPRPAPLAASEMELASDARTRTRAWLTGIKGEYQAAMSPIIQTVQGNEELQNPMMQMVLTRMDHLVNNSQSMESSGLIGAAYYLMLKADAGRVMLERLMGLIEPMQTLDYDALVAALQRALNKADAQMTSFGLEISASKSRKQLGARLDVIAAMGNLAAARGYFELASENTRRFVDLGKQVQVAIEDGELPEMDESNAQNHPLTLLESYLMAGMINVTAAELSVRYANDWLTLASTEGPEIEVPAETYETLGRAYASAGSACMAYFNATVIESRAAANNLSPADYQRLLSQVDMSIPLASALNQHSVWAKEVYANDSESAALYQLASGGAGYLGAALLNMRWYSLDSTVDMQLGTVTVGNRAALTNTLELSRTRALEEAARIQEELGFLPNAVRLNFTVGSALREGDDADKIEALGFFWQCVYLCELSHRLAAAEGSSGP